MDQPSTVTIPWSLLKTIRRLVVGILALAAGIFLIFGWGTIQMAVCAVAVALQAACLVSFAVAGRRLPIVVTSEGLALPGRPGAYKWEDIDGPLVVIRAGMHKAVAFNLTAEYKTRAGFKPASRFSKDRQGYDEAILGDYRLGTEALAALLNEYWSRSSPSTAERAAAVASPPSSAEAQDSGSPILRVAAGGLSLLFAGVLALAIARGGIGRGVAAFMAAFGLMFGWYAVRGNRGLPRALTRKFGD